MNRIRILRVLMDEVAGQTQGACLPFIDGGGLHRGMHRFAFAPDGSLWTGSTTSPGRWQRATAHHVDR